MQTSTTCNNCNGIGKVIDNKPAGADHNGQIKKSETVEINIPAGVEDGMQLKVSGKGNAAPFDGINGDMLVLLLRKNMISSSEMGKTFTVKNLSVLVRPF